MRRRSAALTAPLLMAKRRAAEDILLADTPSKRYCRPLCSVDMRLSSPGADGGVSPQALLGSRCRKRPYYFEEPEQPQQDAPQHRKSSHCDTAIKHEASVATAPTSGNFPDRRDSVAIPSSKKRQRHDSVGSDTVVAKADVEAHADASTEDSSFNSFQYWRVPLPELDLSLLEDTGGQTKHESEVRGCKNSSDAMET